ncbi:hypothetical protein [Lentzea fradiae]|uniref:hypothetical protein n=1 Tax=Lentzea fradiae TaxID=200378 RepID=UPI00115FFC20|nr:hypothetical protein [Lentzea fradiae]
MFVVLSIFFGVLMFVAGTLRIGGIAVFRSNAETLRLSYTWFRVMGAFEIVAAAALAAGLKFGPVAVAGAVMVVLESVMSLLLHTRIREPLGKLVRYVPMILVSSVLLVLAIAV